MMSSSVRNNTGYYSASFLNALECFEFTLARAARTLDFLSSEWTGAIRMDLPSVVNSTWDSGAILSKSRMGRSMTTAQLFPCFTKFLITACPPAISNSMVDQCKYMIAFKLSEVKVLPSFSIDSPLRSLRFHGNGLSKHPKTLEKHRKVRFLSSPLQNPGFPRVFRISGQLLWLSCTSMHVHACTCCVV